MPQARAGLTSVDIFNNTAYNQTSNAAPSSPSGFFFDIGGDFQNAGDFDSASATFPGGSQNLPISGTSFGFGSALFSSLADLHAAFPFGTYTVTATNSGTSTSQSGVIDYAADLFTTDVPALSAATYDGLQGLNTTSNFKLHFNSWAQNPGVTEAFTFFSIVDAATNNTVFTGGFLSTSTTDLALPAGTLLPDTQYRFELDFSGRLNGFDDTNQVFTQQGFDVRTDGSFTTGTGVPEPGCLALFLSGGAMLFGVRMRRTPPGGI
jgi:hypothetical protein